MAQGYRSVDTDDLRRHVSWAIDNQSRFDVGALWVPHATINTSQRIVFKQLIDGIDRDIRFACLTDSSFVGGVSLAMGWMSPFTFKAFKTSQFCTAAEWLGLSSSGCERVEIIMHNLAKEVSK
ncbi:MAG: hypothetical protein GTO41_26635 [Burkholderiales bacterium]|nr:hypothetical protein [Burkholderiales bacterium]